jgi:hypothetical protein
MTIATIQQSRDRSPSRRQDSTPPWLTSLTSLTSRKGLSPAKTTFRLAITLVTHLIEDGFDALKARIFGELQLCFS